MNHPESKNLQSDEIFRQVVEFSPNAFVLVNPQGRIVLVNSKAEKLFGYLREELIGKSIETLVPPRFRSEHPVHFKRFFLKPSPRELGAGRDLFGVRKDGVEVPVEIGLNPIQTKEGLFVLAAVVDIAERKRNQEKVDRANEALRQFSQNSDGREMKMIELKRQVNELSRELGRSPVYDLSLFEEKKKTS